MFAARSTAPAPSVEATVVDDKLSVTVHVTVFFGIPSRSSPRPCARRRCAPSTPRSVSRSSASTCASTAWCSPRSRRPVSLRVERGRTRARSQAMQLLFQAEALDVPLEDVLSGDYLLSKGPLDDFAVELAEGCYAHLDEVDAVLGRVSDNWRLDRMPGTDRNLMRIAVYEMRYAPRAPDGRHSHQRGRGDRQGLRHRRVLALRERRAGAASHVLMPPSSTRNPTRQPRRRPSRPRRRRRGTRPDG